MIQNILEQYGQTVSHEIALLATKRRYIPSVKGNYYTKEGVLTSQRTDCYAPTVIDILNWVRNTSGKYVEFKTDNIDKEIKKAINMVKTVSNEIHLFQVIKQAKESEIKLKALTEEIEYHSARLKCLTIAHDDAINNIVEFAKQYYDLENLTRCEIHRAIIKTNLI